MTTDAALTTHALGGAQMAKTHLTSGERLQVYQALFQLNRSFYFIVLRLIELRSFKTFNPKRLAELRGLTQEMQVEINSYLAERLHTIENEDWGSFGKVRVQRDKRQKE